MGRKVRVNNYIVLYPVKVSERSLLFKPKIRVAGSATFFLLYGRRQLVVLLKAHSLLGH
jgi:hypothetical protein